MHGFVPADGSGDNGVLMVLEAGGGNEAETGIPVTGTAGQYLFSNLKRVDIDREGFRIHNVLSCSPPGNKLVKMPYEEEAIANCAPFLDETIAEMQERCKRNGKSFTILTLGKTAFKRIMGYTDRDAIMRKDYQCYVHWNERYSAFVVAADHPAFLMRGKNALLPVLQFATRRALEVAEHGFTYDNPTYLCDPTSSTFATWIKDYIRAWERDPEGVALAYDIETPYKTGKDEADIAVEDADDYTILQCSFAYDQETAVSIPWRPEYMAGVEELFSLPSVKVGWNSAIYDDPRIKAQIPVQGALVDGMLAWHVLNSTLPKGLGFVTPFYAQNAPMWKHLADSAPTFYSAADGHYTIINYYGIKRDLIANGLWNVFNRHVIKLNVALSYMTGKGLLLDQEMRQDAEVKLSGILERISGEMETAVPEDVRKLKIYKRVPKELKGFDGEALVEAAKQHGFIQVEQELDCRICARCGLHGPLAAHWKSVGKKALKAGTVENPCLGAGVQSVRLLGRVWARRLEFKLSNKSLQAYQHVMHHKAVVSRKESKITFDTNALTLLKKKYPDDPLYQIIGEHRSVSKLLQTYVGVTGEDGKVRGGMPTGRDGRVHTTLSHNPSTLRLASQNPNLQNLPRTGKVDDLQSIIRNLITASPGCTLVARDFSGIEAVLVGYEAQSPDYIRLALNDVHSYYTAWALYEFDGILSANDLPQLCWSDEKLFGRLAEIKKEYSAERNGLYKHLVHSINFGQGAKGAQEKILDATGSLQPLNKISTVMDIYRSLFPAIPKWQQTLRLQADQNGYLRNAFSYTHKFNHVFSWKKEYGKWCKSLGEDAEAVLAFKPQSTAAAIIKEATLRLYYNHFDAVGQYMRLLIHDEIFCDVPDDKLEAVDKMLKDEMERPIPELPMPASWGMGPALYINTESKTGARWGSMR